VKTARKRAAQPAVAARREYEKVEWFIPARLDSLFLLTPGACWRPCFPDMSNNGKLEVSSAAKGEKKNGEGDNDME
jgi:hypothetical protein